MAWSTVPQGDVRYNTDTNEITDIKAAIEKNRADREAQLLHGDTDKYGIYQLKDDPGLRDFHFAGTAELLKRGILSDDFREIQPGNYNLVYAGELSDIHGQSQMEKLNTIYEKFNIDHPAVLDSFIGMFRREVLEQEKEMSAEQDIQKPEAEQPEPEQTKEEQAETERLKPQAEQSGQEKSARAPESEDLDEGDEIIDLGDEKDKVLAEMKQSLEGGQETSGHDVQKPEQAETELAFQIADRYISVQETEGGYAYSVMDLDYKELYEDIYHNPDISIREAFDEIMEDLRIIPFDNGARGNIQDGDERIPIDYDGLMEKVEAAKAVAPQSSVVADFKAKTNELFHEISEMNPAEIEETVKCHVRAQLEESGMDAVIVDVAVVGSRCRGLEQEGSDLDVVV